MCAQAGQALSTLVSARSNGRPPTTTAVYTAAQRPSQVRPYTTDLAPRQGKTLELCQAPVARASGLFLLPSARRKGRLSMAHFLLQGQKRQWPLIPLMDRQSVSTAQCL